MAKDEVYREAEKTIEAARRSGARTLNLSVSWFDRKDGRLTGLPESLRRLTQLRSLDLSGNLLSALPEWLGQLSQLQSLNLSRNQLTTLPECIGQLSQLQSLNLSRNQLTTLPEWIGQLSQLQLLNLSGNPLKRPPDALEQVPNLRTLSLSFIQWAVLPEWISRLSQLESLNLSGNLLTTLPESLLQLTHLQTLELSHNQLSKLPELLGQLTQLQSLNVSHNQLTTLPESLGQLKQLQSLDLTRNQLAVLPESLGQLAQLPTLDLSHNKLRTLPWSLGKLVALTSLNLFNNQLTSVPGSLGQLVRLQQLDLSGNRLTTLPESLGKLTALETLDIKSNQLSELPQSLGQLVRLRSLNVFHNQLQALPESIGQLRRLKSLNVSDNQLTALPTSLGQLSLLESLDTSNNHLGALPESMGQLTQMRHLGLSYNQLTVLPESLSTLRNLKTLRLNNNNLSGIPETCQNWMSLVSLYLRNNQLASLPKSLHHLAVHGGLTELSLHGNPALGLPAEVLGGEEGGLIKPPREVLDYFFSTRGDGGQALRELRLIVVGRPKVGKTSLVKRLRGLPMDPHEVETHGIDILPLDLKCADGPIHARVWDFGGQHVLHAMHEFFLRSRCLYLLVVEQRVNDIERDLTYWLQLIRSYAGDAPVVVALNQSKGIPRPFARAALERDYGPILAWIPTECEPEKKVAGADATILALKAALTEAAASMPEPKKLFPRKWLEIKKWLEGMQEPYLEYSEYARHCAELNESDPAQQQALAATMDDLGVALNYARDPRLRDTTVLRPNWLANGIYALLRANILTPTPLALDGILTEEKVGQILAIAGDCNVLKTAEYPKEKWLFLLRLMNLFQLGFPLDEQGSRCLVPTLLPADEPPDSGEPDGPNLAKLRYEFDVVPSPLMGRLLVRLFAVLDGRKAWQRGARLRYGDARARVWADLKETYVYATVAGGEHDRDELLSMIRAALQEMFLEYERLRVVEQWWHGDDWVPRRTLEKFGILPREDDSTGSLSDETEVSHED